jgi:lipopolysaccharide export system permease protein
LRLMLHRYLAKRFIIFILATFAVCTVLILMIDLVELLRMSRKSENVSTTIVLSVGLLRVGAFSEILLSFAVFVGSLAALLSLNRRSELIVMRAGGMSVWQFLLPGVLVAFFLGVAEVALYNPMAAAGFAEAERQMSTYFGTREGGLLATSSDTSWLRQEGPDGQSIISALASANKGTSLTGVVAYQFDAAHHFVERIDAERALLRDGYWDLTKALVSRPGADPEAYESYSLSANLSPEQINNALGSEFSTSFWQLPDLIEQSNRAGLAASRFRMQYALLMSRPFLFVTMTILAATVSLRSFRSGGIQVLITTGIVASVGFFLSVEVSRQIGLAGFISPMLAAITPIAVSALLALTVLLNQEDG